MFQNEVVGGHHSILHSFYELKMSVFKFISPTVGTLLRQEGMLGEVTRMSLCSNGISVPCKEKAWRMPAAYENR